MPNYNINIQELMAKSFGELNMPRYDALSIPQGETGFKVWEQVRILAGRYQIDGQFVEYPEVVFPAATVVEFRTRKKIVKTEITGRRGTIKELISHGDWDITIRSIVSEGAVNGWSLDSDNYPYNDIALIRNLYEIDAELQVVGEIFTTLGIENIVIEDIELPKLQEFPNLQPIIIRCSSEEALELVVKKNRADINANL